MTLLLATSNIYRREDLTSWTATFCVLLGLLHSCVLLSKCYDQCNVTAMLSSAQSNYESLQSCKILLGFGRCEWTVLKVRF